jgi:HK97 gp10 family phage protein
MVKFSVQGLDKTIKDIGNMSKDIQQEVSMELTAWAMDVSRDAKQLVSMNSSDRGLLSNSINYKAEGLTASVSASVDYAAFIEFGTRKFAAQYVSSLPPDWAAYAATFKGKKAANQGGVMKRLMEWGKRKGFDDEHAYFAAKKILREGTKPHPFLYPAVNKNLPIFMKNVKDLIK